MERKTESYLITIPKRGIKIIPPEETAQKMAAARRGERVGEWSQEEKTRLQLLIESSIMKKRYPTSEDGKQFMEWVDYERRKELFSYAEDLSNHIVGKWKEVNPEQEIAIVLYGSTTRGLVKNPEHPDPSNIDMAVIGEISEEERLALFDAIRPKRHEIQEKILCSCKNIAPEYISQCGNAGVHVQHINKLKVNNYCTTFEYIKARAVALYDPASIWGQIELEALNLELSNQRRTH